MVADYVNKPVLCHNRWYKLVIGELYFFGSRILTEFRFFIEVLFSFRLIWFLNASAPTPNEEKAYSTAK